MENIVTDVFLDSDYVLWYWFYQTRDAIYEARRKELQSIGIASPIRAAVLFRIQALDDKATPSELARWLFRKPHTISSLLTRMEKEGLVRRTKDASRKGVMRIALTEKGGQDYYKAVRRSEALHEIISCLSKKEQQQLQKYLRKLRDQALKMLAGQHKPLFP